MGTESFFPQNKQCQRRQVYAESSFYHLEKKHKVEFMQKNHRSGGRLNCKLVLLPANPNREHRSHFNTEFTLSLLSQLRAGRPLSSLAIQHTGTSAVRTVYIVQKCFLNTSALQVTGFTCHPAQTGHMVCLTMSSHWENTLLWMTTILLFAYQLKLQFSDYDKMLYSSFAAEIPAFPHPITHAHIHRHFHCCLFSLSQGVKHSNINMLIRSKKLVIRR